MTTIAPATIYRGFDIRQNEDGSFCISSMGSYAPVVDTFASEDEAMTAVDAVKRGTFASKAVSA
jgi:hypothetical protein